MPKVTHSSAYHPWCTSGPLGLLRGLLPWESLFGNTELHLCVLSFALPVSFSGMITSLLPQHPIPPSVTLEEIQRFFLNSLILNPATQASGEGQAAAHASPLPDKLTEHEHFPPKPSLSLSVLCSSASLPLQAEVGG